MTEERRKKERDAAKFDVAGRKGRHRISERGVRLAPFQLIPRAILQNIYCRGSHFLAACLAKKGA